MRKITRQCIRSFYSVQEAEKGSESEVKFKFQKAYFSFYNEQDLELATGVYVERDIHLEDPIITSEMNYDEKGNLVSLISYQVENPYGKPVSFEDYSYDSEGNLIAIRTYTDLHEEAKTLYGEFSDLIVEECDDFPWINQEDEEERESEFTLTEEVDYTYDENGNKIEEIYLDKDLKITKRILHSYDSDNNFASSKILDRNKLIHSMYRFVDDSEAKIDGLKQYVDPDTLALSAKYFYDSDNKVKKEIKQNKKAETKEIVHSRKINNTEIEETYNEKNELLTKMTSTFNDSGELLLFSYLDNKDSHSSVEQYIYDSDNNLIECIEYVDGQIESKQEYRTIYF
jgi:hypothetical protein